MSDHPKLAIVAFFNDGPADEGVPSAGSPSGMETGQVRAGTPNSPSADVPGGAAATASPAHAKTCPVPCCCSFDEAVRLGICVCIPEPVEWCPTHFPSFYQQPGDFDREEFDRIVAAIYHRNWEDPARFPDLFAPALAVLGTFAVAGPGLDGEWVRGEAAQVIRRMMRRVVQGETHVETEDHR